MRSHSLGDKESFLQRAIRPEQVMVFGFLALVIVGGLLLALPIATIGRRSVGLLNAMFTATSAVCVTGLVVVDTGTTFSVFGKVVIILLIQIGGLGFMIFATLVMVALGRRISLRNRVLIRESLNTTSLSGMVRLSIWFSSLALLLEFLGACILSIRFIPTFGVKQGILYSLFHAISAFCNAGFDLFGGFRSLEQFQADPLVLLTLASLIIFGGLGFSVLTECLHLRKDLRRLSLHTKVVLIVTGCLLVSGTLIFMALEWNNPQTLNDGRLTVGGKVLNSFFQSTTLRTAGFASLNQAELTDTSKLLSCLFMFIGASPASTGGGVKTTTMSVMILLVLSVIRGQDGVNIFGKRLPLSTTRRALAILFISLGIVLFSSCALSICERNSGHSMMDILFETVSAFGTVGLSSVNTPTLRPISHLILMPIMFFGRVGPLTMAFALASRMENNPKNRVHYPEEKIMIG